jgi:hypothetical protein
MVEVLDLGEEELQEGVIKDREPVVGMENLHLDLKVVKHLFIVCSQREVSSICECPI